MVEFIKGAIAGGWVHIQDGQKEIALVHPNYVDKFIAAPKLCAALKDCLVSMQTAKRLKTTEHLDGAIATAKEALVEVTSIAWTAGR